MSDAPELLFSITGHVMLPWRRLLQSEAIRRSMTPKSRIDSDIIVLNESLFDRLPFIVSAECDDMIGP